VDTAVSGSWTLGVQPDYIDFVLPASASLGTSSAGRHARLRGELAFAWLNVVRQAGQQGHATQTGRTVAARWDFFISYSGADTAWAEWLAQTLEDAGYQTVVQAWDFRPGQDFLHQMHQATQQAARTIAVLSPAYFGSAFGEAEWRVAFAGDPTGEQGLLLPVRVAELSPPGLLRSRVYLDLVGLGGP
jgi:hypothetical protein